MTYQPATIDDDLTNLSKLPAWVTSGRAETLETVAFRSGAVLTVLDQLINDPRHGVPVNLLANRLALKAATATSKLEGRLACEADIRDSYYLTPSGEACGPDGDLLAFWRDAVRLRLNGKDWNVSVNDLIGHNFEDDATVWIEAGVEKAKTHGPLVGCVAAMRLVLEADDRAERIACLFSDIVVARALNWPSLLPITAPNLTKSMLWDLVTEGQTVQRKILGSMEVTIGLARDLASKSTALRAIAPKLRAKGSEAAVALFLSEDAVAPSTMLSPMVQGSNIPMTDRAARRFCDRLVELGVARELTGRPTFRLYGIGP